MTGQQRQIELEMRLSALEYMMGKIYTLVLKRSEMSNQQISTALDQIAEGSETQKFPGLDPVMHDLASDEYARAMRRLTDLIKAMVTAP